MGRCTWCGFRSTANGDISTSAIRVLVGPAAVRVRDSIRQIAMEPEWQIIAGNVARDHVHVFVSYRPHPESSTIVPWLPGIRSRVLLPEFS